MQLRNSGKGYKYEVGQVRRWNPTEQEKAGVEATLAEGKAKTNAMVEELDANTRRTAGLPESGEIKEGKPTVEWVLPDGTLTTDRLEADKVEYYARKERGRRAEEQEIRKMGYNPFNPIAVQQERALRCR
ncbi:MAG: hypothetical protein ACI4AK_01880 [Lepagella sp.]